MKNIDMEIRKHELIVERLKAIKEMELILQGKVSRYSKYMNDNTFIQSVKTRLKFEYELLADLKAEPEQKETITFEANADNYRDIVKVTVPYEWLQSKFPNEDIDDLVEHNWEYVMGDDMFELATKENIVINFEEIYLAGEHED
jgi:hypothetical protein